MSEASLQALVSEVRQAVGDNGPKRSIVRTVHAVGYAFNVDVEQDADSVAEPRAVRAWLVGELSRIPLYAGENILGRDDSVTMVGTLNRTLQPSDALGLLSQMTGRTLPR